VDGPQEHLQEKTVHFDSNGDSVWLMTVLFGLNVQFRVIVYFKDHPFFQMFNSDLETKKTKEKMHELSRQVEIESHKREIVADTLHGQEGVYKLSLCAD